MKRHLLVFINALFFCVVKGQTPTWSQDIAPILYANCTKCHHNGGAGHFSLLSFSDAYTYAYSMANDVSTGVMPPWPPDQNYKHFVAERVLSQTDITKINDWVTGGRPQGDITLAPSQPTYTNTSQLGTVDLTVKIPTYTVGANNDVYRNFVIPSGLAQGKYITAVEVIPGNEHIVHHVLIFQDSTNVPVQLDAAQSGPGYTNAGGTGSVASKLISGYTPGASPYYTPVGTGFRLPAGTNIVVQVHYPAGSQGLVDSTKINFKLTSVAQREITVWPILNHLQNITPSLSIPANTTKTFTEQAGIGSGNYTFISAFPHMHLIGTTIKSFATTTIPNDTIRFLDVPNWDFHWQDTYIFPNALKVPASSTLKAIATYDNTANNPNNPSVPPQNVTAGEATTDEMMMVFFGYMPYVSGDENLIISRRVIPQGATTFCNGQSVVLKTIEGTGYTYQWYRNGVSINGATALSYTATQAGNYHVQIVLGANNTLSDTIAVNIASVPTVTATVNGSTTLCPGNSLAINATTGTGYTYQWMSNGTPIANATSATYTAATAGTYNVQVYNGCYANSNSVVVTAGSTPANTVTPSGATTFCQGGNVTLNAATGLTYHWSNNATTQSITVNQNASYSVTVSDGNGCTAVSTPVAVTVNSLPSNTVSASGATVFCAGNNVVLSAAAGLTYHWNTGATTQSVTATQSGNYIVTVTNTNNCSAVSSSTTVSINQLPNASVSVNGATTFCQGGSVALTALPGLTYHWSNNTTTQSITVNQSGNYAVTVTDANSCSATSIATAVTVNTLPSAAVTASGPLSFCPGGSVTLNGVAGLTYSWSTGVVTQSITASQSGNYVVTVTNSNNCSAVSTVTTVSVLPLPNAAITSDGATSFCPGGSVTLSTVSNVSYLWSNNSSAQSITVSQGGNYTVTVTGANNCTNTASQMVVVYNAPDNTVLTDKPTTICPGDVITLSVPSQAAQAYSWSNNATTQSITVSTSGTFSVTITDFNSCTAVSAPVVVTVSNNAIAGITPSGVTSFCDGCSVQLLASTGTAYLWSTNETTSSITVTASGSYVVSVTVSGNCTAVSTPVSVTVNPNPSAPVITASGATTFCSGGSVALSAPAGFTYLWSTSDNGNSINVSQSGNYTLTITDANSCSAASTATSVTVNPLPTVTLSGNMDTLCSGAAGITLSGENPTGGTFSGTGVTGNTFTPSVTGSQTITYAYADNNGCSNTATESIEVAVCTGIKETEACVLTIYPNPNSGAFEIRLSECNRGITELTVVDVSGKLVFASSIEKQQTQIDLGKILSGCYLVQLKTNNGILHRKLIVSR